MSKRFEICKATTGVVKLERSMFLRNWMLIADLARWKGEKDGEFRRGPRSLYNGEAGVKVRLHFFWNA